MMIIFLDDFSLAYSKNHLNYGTFCIAIKYLKLEIKQNSMFGHFLIYYAPLDVFYKLSSIKKFNFKSCVR